MSLFLAQSAQWRLGSLSGLKVPAARVMSSAATAHVLLTAELLLTAHTVWGCRAPSASGCYRVVRVDFREESGANRHQAVHTQLQHGTGCTCTRCRQIDPPSPFQAFKDDADRRHWITIGSHCCVDRRAATNSEALGVLLDSQLPLVPLWAVCCLPWRKWPRFTRTSISLHLPPLDLI